MSLFSSNPDNQAAERLESLKAGVTGKLTALAVFVPIALLNQYLQSGHLNWQSLLQSETLISGTIAVFSGFLFGVTYRYIVRQDDNPQLQSGAVGAFGLVRGLAQIEGSLDKKMPLWVGGLGVLESLVLFGMIALILNLNLNRGWVQRMK